MFKGDRNFAVGLFVSVAIAAFVVFVIWLTGRDGQEAMTRYSLLFDRDVSGLVVGSQVKFMGMSVGSVIDMELDRSRGVRVQVDIEVLETTPVDSGTYATLASQALTGVAVVNLASESGEHKPLPEPPRGEYPRIPVREVGFAAVMSSAPEIVNKLDILLTRAGEMLSDENRAAVGSALHNVESLSSALAGSEDALAALPQELRDTLAELQVTLGQFRSMAAEVQPGVDEALANLNRSAEHLADLTGRVDELLRRHEAEVGRFMAEGLGEAPALLQDTRQALRELDKLLAQLKEDPSQLIHRPPAEALEIEP